MDIISFFMKKKIHQLSCKMRILKDILSEDIASSSASIKKDVNKYEIPEYLLELIIIIFQKNKDFINKNKKLKIKMKGLKSKIKDLEMKKLFIDGYQLNCSFTRTLKDEFI